MRKFPLTVIVAAAVAFFAYRHDVVSLPNVAGPSTVEVDGALAAAFANQTSNVQVEAEGTVVKVLPDDNEGSRHQRFIVRLPSGQTILIAHNIDLAPRVSSLREGDSVAFRGEYEWNAKGGVVHWTHHDPGGRHRGGWIKHNGRVFH